MRKSSILDFLKEAVKDMVDGNGNIRVIPIGITARRNLSNNKIKFISDLIRLVRDTQIINEQTKFYIFSDNISIRKVSEELNKNITDTDKKLNKNTTMAKIQYDKNKLERIFGQYMFETVLSSNGDISLYEKILSEQYSKYCTQENLRRNLSLNISKDCLASELGEEEFNEFMSTIAPYTKTQMKFIENNIDEKASGYFNYLLSTPNLSKLDKERLDRLKIMLNNGDIEK